MAHAERALGVRLITREGWLKIEPTPGFTGTAASEPVARTAALFNFLNDARDQGMTIRTPDFHRIADAFARGEGSQLNSSARDPS